MGVTVKRRCPLPSPTPGCRENEGRHNEIEGACAGLSCVMRVTAARGESWGLESRGADRILREEQTVSSGTLEPQPWSLVEMWS